MAEYWDIYDRDRNLTGRTIRRGDPFQEGEYYVCCDFWIMNSAGQLLISRRHPAKKRGGLWEFGGGGVLAGETTLQAVVREVGEELGLRVTEKEPRLLATYANKNYFLDVFLIRRDVRISDLRLQPEEVTEAKWVTEEELFRMMDSGELIHSDAVRYQLYRHLI